MKGISSLLDKFKSFIPRDRAVKSELVKVIHKYACVVLDPEQIDIKGFVAYINVSPAAKSEIFLHREDILRELSALLPNTKVKNIL